MAACLIGQVIVHYAEFMVKRVHQVELYKSNVQSIEIMTLLTNHHFSRHSHDQFAVGVMAFGAHRSWSGIGTVQASAGDVITANPGEMPDRIPMEGNARGWRMIYFDNNRVRSQGFIPGNSLFPNPMKGHLLHGYIHNCSIQCSSVFLRQNGIGTFLWRREAILPKEHFQNTLS